MKHARASVRPVEAPGQGPERSDAGFGLYLHWPFCEAKCPYCDFNSYVAREIDERRWADAFVSEVARVGALTRGRNLGSVYFGGGTPSLMSPDSVDRILSSIRQTWRCDDEIEITLEANPSSVEAGRFKGYVGAGVNRFSIGVQALNEPDLKKLGRLHSAREALQAIDIARSLVSRVSFDLIYARQHQSAADWRSELLQALSFDPDHLSLYQLTIEDGTAFGARHRSGKLSGLPDADLSADLFEMTQETCDAAGLPAYEISNHARPGAEGRHNLVYWRYGDYLGVGPGAHGRCTISGAHKATRAEPVPLRWLAEVEAGHGRHEATEDLKPSDQGAEYLMMSLRLREGTSLTRYRELSGTDLPESAIGRLMSDQLVWKSGSRIGTTPRGQMLLNAVLRELL